MNLCTVALLLGLFSKKCVNCAICWPPAAFSSSCTSFPQIRVKHVTGVQVKKKSSRLAVWIPDPTGSSPEAN